MLHKLIYYPLPQKSINISPDLSVVTPDIRSGHVTSTQRALYFPQSCVVLLSLLKQKKFKNFKPFM